MLCLGSFVCSSGQYTDGGEALFALHEEVGCNGGLLDVLFLSCGTRWTK